MGHGAFSKRAHLGRVHIPETKHSCGLTFRLKSNIHLFAGVGEQCQNEGKTPPASCLQLWHSPVAQFGVILIASSTTFCARRTFAADRYTEARNLYLQLEKSTSLYCILCRVSMCCTWHHWAVAVPAFQRSISCAV